MKALALDSFTTFGDLLRYLRQRERLTQRELGQAVGYGEAQINRLESGVRLPDVSLVAAQFIPALHLEDDPPAAARLVELAAQARGEPVPESFTFTRSTRRKLAEEISLSLGKRRSNLPVQVTSFVGREDEIAYLSERIKTRRLLTLTGAGGCGKTRLSLEVATRAGAVGATVLHPSTLAQEAQSLPRAEREDAVAPTSEAFSDGVWLVEFASIADASLAPRAVAAVFSLPDISGTPPIETLVNYLASKHLLLILDNCEHLIEACAALADRLLRGCPNVHLLATSREPLRIPGEVNWRVPSLPQGESIRLFVERAQAIRTDFNLTDHNTASITHICQQLDGIPLAIELAAARLNALSPEQIAARLSDRFNLLTSRNRTVIPRHQTLRATIAWSFDLLTQPERDLLVRLSVFAGGFTVETAEAVADQLNTFGLLSNLVDKSLVNADVGGEAARYRMLETIRQFALEQLREKGEEDTVRDRHLAYFLKLAEAAEIGMRGEKLQGWSVRLEQELDNVRGALTRSYEVGKFETGLRLAGALWLFWYVQDRAPEGLAWVDKLLAASADVSASVRAKALYGAAWMALRAEEFPRLATSAQESLWLSRELNDPIGVALSLLYLGYCAVEELNHQRAYDMIEEALGLLRPAHHLWGVGLAKSISGELLMRQGEFAQAEAIFEEGMQLYGALDSRFLYNALYNMLTAALAQGDLIRAKALAQRRLTFGRENGQMRMYCRALREIGHIALQEGDYGRASELFEECIALFREFGYLEPTITHALVDLGLASRLQGDYGRATQQFNDALACYQEIGNEGSLGHAQVYLGCTAQAQGDGSCALMHFREGVKLSHRVGDTGGVARGLAGMAWVAQAQGNMQRATRLCGFAAKFSGLLRVGCMPAELSDYERIVADAQSRLDDPVMAIAWTEGQKMTLDEAVELALAAA